MKTLYSFIAFALLLLPLAVKTQQPRFKEFFESTKKYVLGNLWHNASKGKDSDESEVRVPEPIGFIGEDYQRFFLHYTAISKSKANPWKYNVTGKTMVINTIRNFSDTITIEKAGIYHEQFDNRYRQGFVRCALYLKEDSTQTDTGTFTGSLTTKFYLDDANNIFYDDLMFGADLYFNNQSESQWKSYKTGKSRTVNWGDYRIPASKEIDIGDGEFMINDRFVKNGWLNYKRSRGNPEDAATGKAQIVEASEWWK